MKTYCNHNSPLLLFAEKRLVFLAKKEEKGPEIPKREKPREAVSILGDKKIEEARLEFTYYKDYSVEENLKQLAIRIYPGEEHLQKEATKMFFNSFLQLDINPKDAKAQIKDFKEDVVIAIKNGQITFEYGNIVLPLGIPKTGKTIEVRFNAKSPETPKFEKKKLKILAEGHKEERNFAIKFPPIPPVKKLIEAQEKRQEELEKKLKGKEKLPEGVTYGETNTVTKDTNTFRNLEARTGIGLLFAGEKAKIIGRKPKVFEETTYVYIEGSHVSKGKIKKYRGWIDASLLGKAKVEAVAKEEKKAEEIKRELTPEEKELEAMLKEGSERDLELLNELKKDRKLAILPDSVEQLLEREVKLDPDIVKKWVNEDHNDNWINIDAKGRDRVWKILTQTPFNWSINQLKEAIQDRNNDYLKLDDLVSEDGLKIGNASDLVKEYRGLYEKHNKYFQAERLLESALEHLSDLDAVPEDARDEQWYIRVKNMLDTKEKLVKAIDVFKVDYEKDRKRIEQLQEMFVASKKLLDAANQKNLYYNPAEKRDEAKEIEGSLLKEAKESATTEKLLGPYSLAALGVSRTLLKVKTEAKEKEPALSITEKLFSKLNNRLKALYIENGKEEEYNDRYLDDTKPDTFLRLAIGIYGFDRLVKEGHIVKDPKKGLYVQSLPEEFTEMRESKTVSLMLSLKKEGKDWDTKKEAEKKLVTESPEKAIETQLNSIFGQYNVGAKWIEGRPLEIQDMDGNTRTLHTNDFEKVSSGEAAFIHTLDKIRNNAKSPGKLVENTCKVLNRYLKFGLINAKKEGEFESLRLKLENNDLQKPISETVKELIRYGFVIEQLLDARKERVELERKFSELPQVQKLGEQLKEAHPSFTNKQIQDICKRVEQRLRAGIALGMTYNAEGKMGGIFGGAANIDLGDGLTLQLGISGLESPEGRKGIDVGAGVSYTLKPSIDSSYTISLGGSFAGFGVRQSVSVPIGKEWNINIGTAAGANYTFMHFLVGGDIGFSWNAQRALESNLQKRYSELGLDTIESAPNKYEAILKHKTLGPAVEKMFAAYEEGRKAEIEPLSGDFKKELALAYYDFMKRSVDDGTIQNLDQPPIPAFGIAAGIGAGIPVIPYFTISLGKKVEVIRVVDKRSMEYPDAAIKDKLLEQFKKFSVDYKTVAETGRLALDKEGNPKIVRKGTKQFTFDGFDTLQNINRAYESLDIEFQRTGEGLLKMGIKGVENSNIKIHLDPKLKETFLVHDKNNFYLSLAKSQNLIITRRDFRYPFRREGAVKETEIFIKASFVSDETIRAKANTMLSKYRENKYTEEYGERGEKKNNNIITYEEYQKIRKEGKIEGFEVKGFEVMDTTPYQRAYQKINEATSAQEKESSIRKNLAELAEKFYRKGGGEGRRKIRIMMTEYGKNAKPDTKKLLDNVEEFLKKEGKPPLTDDLERTMFVQILLELSIRDIKGTPEQKHSIIERDIKRFLRKDLIEMFQQTSYKAEAAKLAEAVLSHYKTTTFRKDETTAEISPDTTGNLFLTMVRGMNVHGARRSLDYKNEAYKLLNPKEFRLDSPDETERKVASALLELQSPLNEKASAQKFLNSSLSVEIAKFAPFFLGPQRAELLAKMYTEKIDPTASSEYKETFEAFKKFVLQVREAEKKGEKAIKFGSEFGEVMLFLEDVKIVSGAFQKCGNLTMVARENFRISLPRHLYLGAKGERTVEVTAQNIAKFSELAILLPFIKFETVARPPEKPGKPGEPRPEAGPGGAVTGEAGKPEGGVSEAVPTGGGATAGAGEE